MDMVLEMQKVYQLSGWIVIDDNEIFFMKVQTGENRNKKNQKFSNIYKNHEFTQRRLCVLN
jgi:hypothetical protein